MAFDEEHWIREGWGEYDESRYNPDDHTQKNCLECGAELYGWGDRSGASTRCPDCELTVMLI